MKIKGNFKLTHTFFAGKTNVWCQLKCVCFFFVCLTILVANNEMNKKPAGNDDAICLLVVGVEK